MRCTRISYVPTFRNRLLSIPMEYLYLLFFDFSLVLSFLLLSLKECWHVYVARFASSTSYVR